MSYFLMLFKISFCIWFSEAFYDLLKYGFPYMYSAWDCRTSWIYVLIASISFWTFPAHMLNIASAPFSFLHLGFHTTYATHYAFCMWPNAYAIHYAFWLWPICILSISFLLFVQSLILKFCIGLPFISLICYIQSSFYNYSQRF